MKTKPATDDVIRTVERLHQLLRANRVALLAAVKVIRTWHGIGSPAGHRKQNQSLDEAWRIYWRNAPEMAPIRAALPGVNLDDPDTSRSTVANPGGKRPPARASVPKASGQA